MTISVLYYVSFGWLGTVVGIVGLILAVVGIVLTLRSRAVARLVYQTRDLVLVGQPDAIPYGEVKILFNDNVVPRVMVSHLAVWNAGNTTIRSNDVVESDPMKVAF